MIVKNFSLQLHKLHKIGDEILRPIADAVANNIAAIPNEVVSWWCAFQVSGAVSNHNDLELTVALQLARIEVSDLCDRFTFSSTSACRLIGIEGSVISIEIKQKFVGEQIVDRDLKFPGDGVDKRVETPGDQVNLFVFRLQVFDELSGSKDVISHYSAKIEPCVVTSRLSTLVRHQDSTDAYQVIQNRDCHTPVAHKKSHIQTIDKNLLVTECFCTKINLLDAWR